MNRLEFLKNVGFRGPALMALLTSCDKQEDTVIEALSLQNQTETTAAGTTPDTSSTTTPTTPAISVKLNSSAAISPEALNAIKTVSYTHLDVYKRQG